MYIYICNNFDACSVLECREVLTLLFTVTASLFSSFVFLFSFFTISDHFPHLSVSFPLFPLHLGPAADICCSLDCISNGPRGTLHQLGWWPLAWDGAASPSPPATHRCWSCCCCCSPVPTEPSPHINLLNDLDLSGSILIFREQHDPLM